MNNTLVIDEVFNYFKEILDIPSYYTYSYPKTDFRQNISIEKTHPCLDFEFYATIDNIKVYLVNPDFKLFKHNTLINSRLVLIDDNIKYELLTPVDDFTILVINDIIKHFGGILL